MKKSAQMQKEKVPSKNQSHKPHGKFLVLAVAALGIVYGDIGTSPLYVINEIFFGKNNLQLNSEIITGGISLVIWALTIVVTIKYLIFVLRADNDGQGGVFALYGLLNKIKTKAVVLLMAVLLLTAGLLFGDGIITPAISVLSAVEGLKIATPFFDHYVVLITILILTGLFSIQSKGTSKVGKVFGPIIFLWFISIAFLGLRQILITPVILNAFNPIHAINFLQIGKLHQILLVLGSVMLAVTGGEALYADMGHFGTKPIRTSWFAVVYPALILNYLGQGAYILSGQQIVGNNVFYSLVPQQFIYPMVLLATMATVIASQALISGAFSLTTQAIALGLMPRLRVKHTHHEHEGQIYVGFINWALFVGCVLLVLIFKSSTNLASAYGLAVSGDMLATSVSMIFIATFLWKWNPIKTLAIFGSIAVIDASFLIANSLKFFEGGFIPMGIGILLFLVMNTWKWGRIQTNNAYSDQKTMTVKELIALKNKLPNPIERTIVFMAPKPIRTTSDNTPALLQFFYERYGTFPKDIVFLDIITRKIPYFNDNRFDVRVIEKNADKGNITSVTVQFGFMENPDVEAILKEIANHFDIAHGIKTADWKILVSHENIIADKKLGVFKRLRLGLFKILRQNSIPFYYYYGLGNDVRLGMEIMPVKIK